MFVFEGEGGGEEGCGREISNAGFTSLIRSFVTLNTNVIVISFIDLNGRSHRAGISLESLQCG